MSIVLLAVLTCAVCMAPLVPAWLEWRVRRDALPLGIEQSEFTSIRVFAERFRDYVQRELVADPEAAATNDEYLFVSDASAFAPVRLEQSGQRLTRRVISDTALNLPDGYSFEREVYSRGHLNSGRRTRLRAALSDQKLELGEGSVVLRWADANEIYVAPQARLLGRASAAKSIELAPGSEFRRLHAPTVVFGKPLPAATESDTAETGAEDASAASAEESSLVLRAMHRRSRVQAPRQRFGPEVEQPRWLVHGELSVPDNRQVDCALVVRGRLNIGAGAYVLKGIKGYRDVVIGHGAITGAIVSRRDVIIGANCIINGPVVAHGRVIIGAGSRLGSVEQPTTLTAREVSVESGAVIHGTVWARERGIVS